VSNLNRVPYRLVLKQGLASDISGTAAKNNGVTGEPAYTTDTKQLYIHDGTEYVPVKAGALVLTDSNGDEWGVTIDTGGVLHTTKL